MRSSALVCLALVACSDPPIAGNADGSVGLDAAAPDAKTEPAYAATPIAPGARTIVFSSRRTSGEHDLFLTDLDGVGLEQLTANDGDDYFPAFSADKSRILFSGTRGSTVVGVYEMALPSHEVRALVDSGFLRASTPAISPDGTRVAFEGLVRGSTNTDIFLVTNGGAPTRLTPSDTQESAPTFSPDGQRIFFVSNRDQSPVVFSAQLYSMRLDGMDLVRETSTTTPGLLLGRPSVSPDGMHVAFARFDYRRQTSIIVELDRATHTEQVISEDNDYEPSYGSEGRYLVFGTARFGGSDLMLLDRTAGGAPKRITQHLAVDGQPALAPP